MQLPLLPTVAAVFGLFSLSLQAGNLTSNAYFKALDGNWTGQGELKNAEGETFQAANKIKAHFSEDGGMFIIEGNIQVNDQELPYRWEYINHTVEGLYAARFIQNGKASDFDATVDTANMRSKVTQVSGSSADSRIEMDSRLENGKYIVTFKIISSSGNTDLEGSIQFAKES